MKHIYILIVLLYSCTHTGVDKNKSMYQQLAQLELDRIDRVLLKYVDLLPSNSPVLSEVLKIREYSSNLLSNEFSGQIKIDLILKMLNLENNKKSMEFYLNYLGQYIESDLEREGKIYHTLQFLDTYLIEQYLYLEENHRQFDRYVTVVQPEKEFSIGDTFQARIFLAVQNTLKPFYMVINDDTIQVKDGAGIYKSYINESGYLKETGEFFIDDKYSVNIDISYEVHSPITDSSLE